MAAFDLDAVTQHPPDFRLIADGGVALFLRDPVLRETEDALRSVGYELVALDAGRWADTGDLHDSVAAALSFPDYYGRNFSALDDCLGDVAHGDYAWNPATSTGLLVTVRGFGSFTRRQPTVAGDLAASFMGTTQTALLFGHRIGWLLHVDDPDFRLQVDRSGFLPWNGREWLDASRR